MNYSYVIYSPDNHLFYYGCFDNLDKVVEMHNSGQIDITRGKGPWVLVFSENFDSKVRALRQSRFYRTTKGQRYLKKTLNF
jgi:putative endonuclease